MPFGHGIEDPNDFYPNERWLKESKVSLDDYVRSGPGYVLSKNVVTGKITADVDNSTKTEPALSVGLFFGIIPALVGAVSSLWPDLIPKSVYDLVIYFVALLTPIVTAFFIRGKVWSPASVSEVLKAAIEAAETSRKK